MSVPGRIFGIQGGVRSVSDDERRRMESGCAVAVGLLKAGVQLSWTGWHRLPQHGPDNKP